MRICVFCGSSGGKRPIYLETAVAFGKLLAEQGIGLVYGGGRVGIMGVLAQSVMEAGGEVIGVIPEALAERELANEAISELLVVGSMHERKAKMAELADGFVALPGGIGTLEELFEIWTWAQLGIHRKPVGVLNVAGYYDALHQLLVHMAAEGFVREDYLPTMIFALQGEELLTAFEQYEPPEEKWRRLKPSES